MRIFKFILLILTLLSLSCSDDLKFINPFDPAYDPSLWAPKNLLIEPQSSSSIKVSWTKVNARYDGFKISRKVSNGAWENDIAKVGSDIVSWIDTKAPYGTTYTYSVRAYAGSNHSNAVEKTKVIVLYAPTNLSITPQSATSLRLAWTDTNQFEEGYKISRKAGNGIWQENIATVGENRTTWIDDNAPIGNTYTYRVRAYAGANYSSSVDITEDFVLSAPGNLILTPLSATSIKLNWTDTNQFEEGYKISRKVGDGEWQANIAVVGANRTTWVDMSASYGTTYTYRVRAYAGANYSSSVDKTMDFVLSAPGNLILTPQSATSIKLNWTDINQFEEGYKISRKVGNSAWEENIATVGTNRTTWIDNDAPIGNTYTYRVRAYAGGNQSNAVEKTEAFVLSAPTNLTITPQSASSLKLTWTDTNQFEQGFKISRKVDNGAWQENIATVGANVTNWVDSSININFQYQYRIRAYYQNHYSAYSNIGEYKNTFVFVQGGTFQMGSNTYSNELPIHSVTLSSFLIGKYEVTQEEWETVMTGNNNGISATPSSFSGNPNRPVESVSWYAAIVFCNRKSIQEGLTPCYEMNGGTSPDNWGTWNTITCNWSANGYRLPTEAEWEYAARGGNQSNGYTYSGSNTVGDVAWYSSNSGGQTHDVGTKAPNELGIYDMSGNVREWCWDWYDDSYYSSSPSSNPKGPISGSYRVNRGGSWYSNGVYCRVAYRRSFSPGNSLYDLGFRLVRTFE